MEHITRLGQQVLASIRETREFDRNVKLLLLTTILNWVGQGIFLVAFNLYVLSMGIETAIPGRILSAGPLAHALASIPMGFLGEKIGHKSAFVAIYLIGGISCLMQASTPNVSLIAAAAFFGGLALAGDFVMRLPFLAANAKKEHHTRVFSLDGLLISASFSIGALLAGDWLPEGIFYTIYLPLALWSVIGYLTVVRFLSYLDLRIRREGWEVELVMRAEAARIAQEVTA